MLDQAQLSAYLARIGYDGPREPSLAALRAIVAGHGTSIPFENIDVLLGRGVRLETAALLDKLVERRRGGYCFEHNSLLLLALQTLGFDAHGLGARVVWNQPEGGAPLPRTHMLLRVALPDGPYLADVGFGGLSLTAPIRFETGLEQDTPHEPHRLIAADDETELHARLDGGWTSLYHFGPDRHLPIDYEVANWYTATYPGSLFTENLMMARPEPDRRYALLNRNFTIRWRDGRVERRTLDSAADLGETWSRYFRLELPESDTAAAWAKINK